jgi:hypothetical protein
MHDSSETKHRLLYPQFICLNDLQNSIVGVAAVENQGEIGGVFEVKSILRKR